MNKLNSYLSRTIAFGTVLLCVLHSPYLSYAQYYGQNENKPMIVVDKKIGFEGNKNYFDNVGSDQKIFGEGNQIFFKIVVENKSNESLYDVKVKDILPKYLSLLMYPGIYNSTDNSIETTIKVLKSGESKEFLIIAKMSDLSTGNSDTKLQQTNKVCASNDLVSDCDNAKYFIAYKSIPTTGANDLMVKTGLILSGCGIAIALRKKARGY